MIEEKVQGYICSEDLEHIDVNKKETRHDNFIRVTNSRLNQYISLLRKFYNLTNKEFYEYSDEEIKELIQSMREELDVLEVVLTRRKKGSFTLNDKVSDNL